MSVEEFVCYPCGAHWHDKYSFWRGYQSFCPWCGESRRAIRDARREDDNRRAIKHTGFDIAGPLFESEENGAEETEGDLVAEQGQIHDEIAEALGSVDAETSDIDADAEGSGADAGESDGGAGGDR